VSLLEKPGARKPVARWAMPPKHISGAIQNKMTDTTNQNQGCLTSLLRLFGIKPQVQPTPANEPLPYRIRDDFLSSAEMSFYHVIMSIVGKRATICPKVSLADIFFVARPHENQAYRGRIAQKHLDFLLCEPKTMRPIVGIELDDSSRTRSSRQARDEFVDKVFQTAELPLIRVAVQSSYSTNELSAQLEQYLASASTSSDAALAQSTQVKAGKITSPSPPLCPKCGVPMVVRTVAQGEHRGKQFYGCPNYPRCREMRRLA
jgi:Protein of unknown function (DUF2726)/Topoisomerase DNA binding C4 zinc finger